MSAHVDRTRIQSSSTAAPNGSLTDDGGSALDRDLDLSVIDGVPSALSKGGGSSREYSSMDAGWGAEGADTAVCATSGGGAILVPPKSTNCSGLIALQSRRNTCEDSTISRYRNHCGSAVCSLLRLGGALVKDTDAGCRPAFSSKRVRITPKCAMLRRLARLPGNPVVSTANVRDSLPACLFTSASPRSSLLRLSYPKSSRRTKPVRTSSSRSCERREVRFCKPWMDKKLSRALQTKHDVSQIAHRHTEIKRKTHHWHADSNPSSAITARHSAYARSTAR